MDAKKDNVSPTKQNNPKLTKEDIIKSFNSVEYLVNEQVQLGKDALCYISEKCNWDDFMKYHFNAHVDRQVSEER